MNWFQVASILCLLHQHSSGYNILGIFPVATPSHYSIGHALLKALAEEGHEVTMIGPFEQKNPIKNYNQVYLELSWAEKRKTYGKNNFVDLSSMYFPEMFFKYYSDVGDRLFNWTMSSKNFQAFLKEKHHFDVVVQEVCLSEFLLGFGQYFNAPIIATTVMGSSKWTSDLVGSPVFASYVPHHLNHYTDRMTFWQRMYNSLMIWFEDIVHPYYFIARQQKYMEQLFPESVNWPSLEEIRRNVSLVLLNTHTTLGSPRPYAPNMIEVGGLQIPSKVEPLPQKLQTFLDDATNGAIYWSLGSNVRINNLQKHQYDAIINAFKPYPHLRILIKSEENLILPSHNAADVLVQPWFPQHSILAHKNVKLFITQGGMLSTTEAVHFGKPVVGIPVFFDQYLNMKLAQQKGYGIMVPIETLNTDNIAAAINEVLLNSSYAEAAKLISERFRDQPLPPLELAKHWVKHVAKNKGAPHLRSAAVDLPFYALYNLDVWALIIAVLLLAIVSLIKILKFVSSIVFGSKSGKKLKKA